MEKEKKEKKNQPMGIPLEVILVFMNGNTNLIRNKRIKENREAHEKAIINFYNDGDMDGCWLYTQT